jgi:hypothetical protein
MDKKSLMSQSAQSVNNLTIQNLPNELAELSDEDLSQIRGGWKFFDNLDNVTILESLPPDICWWPIVPKPEPDIFTHSHTDVTTFAL